MVIHVYKVIFFTSKTHSDFLVCFIAVGCPGYLSVLFVCLRLLLICVQFLVSVSCCTDKTQLDNVTRHMRPLLTIWLIALSTYGVYKSLAVSVV